MLILYFSILFLCIIGLILTFYFEFRNRKVYEFRETILTLSSKIELKKIKNGIKFKNFYHFDKLPHYTKMVYSFKKINFENYFTPDEIKELKGEHNEML